MKIRLAILALTLILTSCKKDTQTTTEKSIDYELEPLDVTTSIYPENITKVFEAHGGLDAWKKMNTLTFTMQKESGLEVTTTDLQHRYSRIDMPNHILGYDGDDLWLMKKDTTSFKGHPKFYYNLMFYFYAMPFVLADDGINYDSVEPLVFEGNSYPGIKISYENGVGESPDDEYIVYYDANTHQMIWLAYTVTYFSKEKSKEFHYIKYSDWQDVNGLTLPKTLTWYNYENNLPITKRNAVEFTDVLVSKAKTKIEVFQKPEVAELVE